MRHEWSHSSSPWHCCIDYCEAPSPLVQARNAVTTLHSLLSRPASQSCSEAMWCEQPSARWLKKCKYNIVSPQDPLNSIFFVHYPFFPRDPRPLQYIRSAPFTLSFITTHQNIRNLREADRPTQGWPKGYLLLGGGKIHYDQLSNFFTNAHRNTELLSRTLNNFPLSP